jgi:ankyrin repeat protein
LDDEYLPEYDDLCYKIKRGKIEEVKEHFRKNKDFNPKLAMKPNGDTILHVCAEFDQTAILEWAMNHWRHKKIFADEQNEAGETPLMIAAREGKFNTVNMILTQFKKGIHVDRKSKDGWTALFYAAHNGWMLIFNLLVNPPNSASIFTYDRLGRSILHYGARFNNMRIVEYYCQ